MANTYDQDWPSSFADQKNYADYLLNRAKILYSRKTPITVNKFIEPAQGDWENAYVSETGLPLPIPVGTKLFWRSLHTGRVIQYGTINDANNGLASSGTVYNLLNMNYSQPSFRFLAYADTNKYIYNNHVYSNREYLIPVLSWMPSGSFIYGINNTQIFYWMTQGLESLYLVYRVRAVDLLAAPPTTVNILFNRGSGNTPLWTNVYTGNNNMESMYLKMAGNVAVMASLGTPTSTADSDSVPITGTVAGSDSIAGAFTYGQTWMHNVAQQLENTVTPVLPRENYHQPMGYGRASYLGASVSDATSAIMWGMFGKEDQGITVSNYFDVGLNNPVLGTGIHSAKLWVYGLFKNLTGEFRG